MKKAALYARVSSKKQKEGETINSQVEALTFHAKKEGYLIPENWFFLDDGISGEKLQRAALDELRDVIRTEPLDTVFIYAPDRLSRRYSLQLVLLEEFKRCGVKVCFLKDSPNTDTPEGRMFNHFQGIFAEYERASILDRSRRGRLFKARQGDPSVLPSVPYGYKKVKRGRSTVVEISEREADVVKRIFKMYVYDKASLSKIAQALSDLKSPRGSFWDVTTIRNILKNPSYTGTAYYGKTEKAEDNVGKIRRYPSGKILQSRYSKRQLPEEKWIPISVPQIINENDFELAQEQVKRNKEFASRNTKEIALLQGLVVCAKCGNPFYKRMRTYRGKSKGHYYCRSQTDKRLKKCSSKCVDQIELDELVYNEVVGLLQDPSILHEELSRRAKQANNKEEIDRQEILLKKEFSKISKERDRLLDAYQSGVLDLQELSQRNKQLDERRKIVEKDVTAIQAQRMEREIDFTNIFESILKRMKKSAKDLPIKEKQKLIRLLVEKVVINEEEIKIIHCISGNSIRQEICQLTGDDRKR